MTNYEKIKSMSINKMAELIAYNFDESPCLSQVKVWLKAETKKGQMTNYEKIKTLSHDEMAKFLKDNFDMSCEIMCPYVDEQGNCTDFSYGFDCIDALKDWLKAESEEEQMTVEDAIEELKRQYATLTMETDTNIALSMAISALEKQALSRVRGMSISALEKEKEPQPVQADKDSSKNNSIDNDNTKLKECQEVINVAARILTSYMGYLPEREQELWKMGGAHALLKKADKLFEGGK